MSAPGDALAALCGPLAAAQALLTAFDEGAFHRARGLGPQESRGHAADSLLFAAALAPAALMPPTPAAAALYAGLALASTAAVTKDEWIHARECEAAEHWVHAALFALHPAVLIAVGALWARGEGELLRRALPAAAAAYAAYQWLYWLGLAPAGAGEAAVDNEFYDGLGALWHEGDGHAIALLRAETPVRLAFVRAALARAGVRPGARVLDVGCGGGFLANPLAADGFRVKGIDRSASSLDAARARTPADAPAQYAVGDALALTEPEGAYDAVLMMDLLEHLDDPARALAEAARSLRPGGALLVHTFNRTPLAWLLAVKGIGFVTREGPRNVHSHALFITPDELAAAGRRCGLALEELDGIRPRLDRAFLWSLLRRRVHPGFAFTRTRSTRVGYLGRFVRLATAVTALGAGPGSSRARPAP